MSHQMAACFSKFLVYMAEGIPAVIVGRFTDSNERLILNEDEVRYMDRPQRDEIYKSV